MSPYTVAPYTLYSIAEKTTNHRKKLQIEQQAIAIINKGGIAGCFVDFRNQICVLYSHICTVVAPYTLYSIAEKAINHRIKKNTDRTITIAIAEKSRKFLS